MIIVKRKSPEEWIEWQADNFASSLLMPKEVFKFKYEELKKKIFEEENRKYFKSIRYERDIE